MKAKPSPPPSWTGWRGRSATCLTHCQPRDTGTATGRLMLAVIGAVGQAEREAMLERQRDGIARAKAQGRYKGRCRPFANRLLRSSGSNRRASGPRKSPAGWGSVGRACIGCWATRPPVNIKKLPDRLSAGPKDCDQRPTFDQMLKDAVRLWFGHLDGLVDRSVGAAASCTWRLPFLSRSDCEGRAPIAIVWGKSTPRG